MAPPHCPLSSQHRAVILRSWASLCRAENGAGTAHIHPVLRLNSSEDCELQPMVSSVVMRRNLKLYSKFLEVFFSPSMVERNKWGLVYEPTDFSGDFFSTRKLGEKSRGGDGEWGFVSCLSLASLR